MESLHVFPSLYTPFYSDGLAHTLRCPLTPFRVPRFGLSNRFLLHSKKSSLLDGSRSLYEVQLRTSSIYDSAISDLQSGVLTCIIDENGDSILQRIPAILCQDDIVHFQSGKDKKDE